MARKKNSTAVPVADTAVPVVTVTAPQPLPWQGVQNGVTPPKRVGACSAVWSLVGELWPAGGACPTLAQVKVAGLALGLNGTNISIEYYRCRQWHGVRGRQPATSAAAAE